MSQHTRTWNPGPLPVEEFGRLVLALCTRPEIRLTFSSRSVAIRTRQKFYLWRAREREVNFSGLEPTAAGVLESVEIVNEGATLLFRTVDSGLRRVLDAALGQEPPGGGGLT